MKYWIHRCRYMNGHTILDEEHRLTIGFSDCANSEEMVAAVEKKDGAAFDNLYRAIYGENIWRARWALWYFTCEMTEGDVVVVPRDGGFTVCRLKGKPIRSERRNEADIGWEWDVEMLAPMCDPREAYASAALLSRMKCRQTTLNIDDLAEDVEKAVERFRYNKPFSLPGEMADKCHELLARDGSPDQFERLIRDYFTRLGGKDPFAGDKDPQIQPKHYGGKVGDCDVTAMFPALRLIVSVQAKFHAGETGDWAVRQIAEYAEENQPEENWTYANWVVSFADTFSEEAKKLAREKGVILIDGKEFCSMLVAGGLGIG